MRSIDTSLPSPEDIVEPEDYVEISESTLYADGRSVVVLFLKKRDKTLSTKSRQFHFSKTIKFKLKSMTTQNQLNFPF